MVQSENSAVCNRVLCKPVTHTPKKKTVGGELRKQRPHTYESPRKSWNLIRPAVVSASKLGNTSPSRSPGMVGPSLQLRQREVEERSQLGSTTEEEETT